MDDLVRAEGLYWKKFIDLPFTGKLDEGRARGAIKNGKFEGLWVMHHDNGRLWSKGAYKSRKQEGPWVAYCEDGTKAEVSSGIYRNDKKASD